MSKENKSMFGTGCMIVLLLMSIGLNIILIGCKNQVKDSPLVTTISSNTQTTDLTSLRTLAGQCGVANSQSLGFEALISEIKIKLGNKEQYYGKRLSEQELKDLSGFLADDPKLLRTIKEYDDFIRKLNGQKFVILP